MLKLPGIMFRVELLVSAVLSCAVALLAGGTEFGSVNTMVESTTTDPLLQWQRKKATLLKASDQQMSRKNKSVIEIYSYLNALMMARRKDNPYSLLPTLFS